MKKQKIGAKPQKPKFDFGNYWIIIVASYVAIFFILINTINFIILTRNKSVLYYIVDNSVFNEDKINFIELINRPLVAVIIENFIEARPVSGINQAMIVYEVEAEGGITRYLAIFSIDSLPEKIGPVRSVRPYLIDWASEHDALILHSGGSPDALKALMQSSVLYINEISGDGIYFWRDDNRGRPHNLFTSAKLIKKAVKNKEIKLDSKFTNWGFKEEQQPVPCPKEDKIIQVEFLEPEYRVKYKYDCSDNSYLRFLNNKIDVTASGEVIKVKNIVIQYTEQDIIDEEGRLDIQTKGFGRADTYQDGIEIKGSWKFIDDATKFYDENDNEMKFNAGPIWIEIVSHGSDNVIVEGS